MSIDALTARTLAPQATQPKDVATASTQAPTANATVPQVNKAPPTINQVRAAAEQIEKFLKSSGRDLEFHVDTGTGHIVVSVRDAASGDLIRQMPSEEALRLAQSSGIGTKSLVDLLA
jgi:flagellar protein FlaG